jgi:N-methylhydantoinase B
VSVIRRTDGREEIIPSKRETRLNKGDRLVLETAGGGGYGDPKTREKQRIVADVADGKLSPAAAKSVYGVEA